MVQNLLGLAGYYRRFVKNVSRIALPLTNLMEKDTKFEWTYKCEEAFQTHLHPLFVLFFWGKGILNL